MKRALTIVLIAGIIVVGRSTNAELIINLNFNNTNAPADGSPILGGATRAQANATVQAAANYWMSAFANSSSTASWATSGTLTHTIDVGWTGHGGTTLATGGTSWFPNGQLVNGQLLFDNDGTSNFYVDANPLSQSEWNQSSNRSMTFNGVSMNVERVHFDAPAGVVRDNSDLLTVAIHEIGHALGFLGSYPGFAAHVSGGNFSLTSGTFNGALIPVSGGHTNFQILSPNTQFPYNPGGGGFFPQFNYYPNVMGPSLLAGTRTKLTEVDIAIAGAALGFYTNINFNPVPEPHAVLLCACYVPFFIKRRRHAAA